jgi:aminotransferase
MGIEKYAKKEALTLMGAQGISTRAAVGHIEGLINLGAGDPDFNQPEFLNMAVYDAMVAGHTHYSFGGISEFKEAIAKYYKKYEVDIDPKTQVLITSGGSQAIFQAFGAILNPGDELIVLDPAYHGYTKPITYFGAKMIRAKQYKNREGIFRPDFTNIEAAITDKTKAILYCTPDNPTGTVWTKKELEKLAKIASKHDIVVISDEIYTEFIWGNKKHNTIIDLPGMWDRTLVLMSFSKTFAWTGCRAGYIIAGPELMKLVSSVPVGICSMPVPFQKAAILDMVNRLNEIDGVKCAYPEGAFYLFPDISSYGIPSRKFSTDLFIKEKVRCAAGSTYGEMGEGHIRFALVRSIEDLKEVCTRLERFIKNLPPQAPPTIP